MKETFGQWLRYKRMDAELSQDQVADRSGISKSAISLYERDGIKMPRLSQLDRLADALGIGKDEMRAAYSSRAVISASNYGDVESYEVLKGVTIMFDRRLSKLDQQQRDELVRMIKLVATGMRKGSALG